MGRIYLFIILFVALIAPHYVSAQMFIDEPSDSRTIDISFADSVRIQRLSPSYFSPALHRHHRELIRRERNTIEVNGALQGSLTNLSESWIETSGGDNSITLMATLIFKHTFTKNLFSLESYLSTKFGYYHVVLESELDDGSVERDPVWYKNQDEFQLSITPSIKMSNNWSYGANLKFRSQFTKGFVSSASQEDYNLKSDILSPGYLDISGGLIYNCPEPKFPVKVTLSPLAMSAIYVSSSQVRNNAQFNYSNPTTTEEKYLEPYGVSPAIRSKYEGGSSIQIDFDRSFGKDNYLRYVTSIFSFYGWTTQLTARNVYSDIHQFDAALDEWNSSDKEVNVAPLLTIHPTLRWENRVEIKASKYLSTTLNFQLYYNRAQNLKVQTQTLLSVGLAYNFNSKNR